MTGHPQFNLIHDNTIRAMIIALVLFLILISINIFLLAKFKADTERAISSGENITKVTNVTDIKHRMEYHGCLVCWKDSMGMWWFHRDGKQYRLWSPK